MKLNFERDSIKKLINDYIGRAKRSHVREADFYLIEIETKSIEAILKSLKETMVRRVEAITKAMDWNNLVDAISIKSFLNNNKNLEDQDAIIKEKKIRSYQEDVIEFSNKKRPPRIRESTQGRERPFYLQS